MNSIKKAIESNIKDYYNTVYEIECTFALPAFEAEIPNQNQTRTTGDRLKETIDKIIKTLAGIIEKFALKLSNLFKSLMQSDTGFIRNCREAMVNHKPLEGVKLIVYQYNDSALDTAADKFTTAITKRMDALKQNFVNKEEVEGVDTEEDIIAGVLQDAGAPSDVKNLETYYSYMKDIYRVEKKETLFTAVNSKAYYSIATSATNMRNIMNARQSKLKQYNSQISSGLKNMMNRSDITDEQKSRFVKRSRSLAFLFNTQTHFLDMYLQLKVEKIFTYRAVLKKLYHFS